MPMLHYSFATKKTRTSRREEMPDEALNPLRRLAHYGGSLPCPREKFSLRLTHTPGGAVFTLMQGKDALIACGLAWDPQGSRVVWNTLKNLIAYSGDKPKMCFTPKGRPEPPERLPWTGAVELPGWQKHTDLEWIEPFLQQMAWVIWETRARA